MYQIDSGKLLLPNTPSTLCFNKEHFAKQDFNVDQFVVECRRHVSLEILRNDLHLYLKILQNSMIELINKDYADFLNLSTNLVGMDKSINHLIQPLNHIKKDICVLNESAKEKLKLIKENLKLKGAIRDKKERLRNMAQVIKTLENIELLQGVSTNQLFDTSSTNQLFDTSSTNQLFDNSSTNQLSFNFRAGLQGGVRRSHLVERLCCLLNNLHVNLASPSSLVSNVAPRVEEIMDGVSVSLESSLKECLSSNDKQEMLVLLRSYDTIGRAPEAEEIFQRHIVKPYMQEVINEAVLREAGLEGMFEKVLQFVPSHCALLKQLTTGSENSVSGYDMLVRAVWPEVVEHIHSHTPSIFAPGNPDVFHQNYKSSMQFVKRFEKSLSSVASVKRLRSHPSFLIFQSKWGLSIYFQIRFQEIAGRLEASLQEPFQQSSMLGVMDDSMPSSNETHGEQSLRLQCSVSLCECLSRCWSEAVFLDVLLHRFWKLSLQLCARYATWLRELSADLSSRSSLVRTDSSSLLYTHSKKSSDPLPPDFSSSTNHTSIASSIEHAENHDAACLTLHNCISVFFDIRSLASIMKKIFEHDICSIIMERKSAYIHVIRDAWKEGGENMEKHIPVLKSFISANVSNSCLSHLKEVNNIPRLYKRTNRENPTKASPYVGFIITPLRQFVDQHRSFLQPSDMHSILLSVLCAVSEQYQSTIQEVLTSLRRMEESLKRLKAARQGGAQVGGSKEGLSDDDKIKMQLRIDVQHFVDEATWFGMEESQLDVTLDKLKQVVVSDA